jgi:Tfp pilus assembly protein PilN
MKAVNLLPPDQRGVAKATAVPAASQSGGTGAYAVLGALAIGVVSVAGYVLAGNTVKDREAQLAGLTVREKSLQAKVGDLKPYADFAQLASARVATVKDLAGRRFDWENALRDLSRAIPANVTLNSLTGTVSSDGSSGGSSLRGAIPAPAITVTGCTTSQPEVAKLMARLRTVDGVTRVSLSKSEKSDATGAAAAPTAPGAAGGTNAGCGAGSPPQFEMVMFFERAAQATAAPTGSAGTATAAAATATTPGAATPAAGTTPAATTTPAPGSPAATPAATGGTSTPTSAAAGG